ncbi:MAG: hypothetical protein H6Q19_2218 [Bacteroidetes bacterium]|nr:hypothetical protein [Bacteroidota bacterium]
MKNSLIIITGFFTSIILSGCIVYQTQMTDVPLISEKSDLRIDAGVSVIPAVQTTVSYGLTDKIAIQGYGSVGADHNYYFQAATGLYKNKGNDRVMEVYGGFGYGYGDAYKALQPDRQKLLRLG